MIGLVNNIDNCEMCVDSHGLEDDGGDAVETLSTTIQDQRRLEVMTNIRRVVPLPENWPRTSGPSYLPVPLNPQVKTLTLTVSLITQP